MPVFPGRIRIVSDGTARETRVYDADTGAEVPRGSIKSITWQIDAGHMAQATVVYVEAEVDVIGLAQSIEHPPVGVAR